MASPDLENAGQRIARAQLVASSLPIFWDELRWADWTYNWSDDHAAYERGQRQFEKIREMAAASEDHMRLYLAFCAHHRALAESVHIPKDQRASYPIPELPSRPL